MSISAYTQALAWVLGDPLNESITQIPAWAEKTEHRLVDEEMSASLSAMHSLLGPAFESGAALLHDSRLVLSIDRFRTVSVIVSAIPEARILTRLGHGRALSALRRFPTAEQSFAKAIAEAEKLGKETYIAAAHILYAMNDSDWGEPNRSRAPFDLRPRESDGALHWLIEAYRVLALSRFHFRRGERRDALRLLEGVLTDARSATLAPIPRGSLIRMYGIVQAVTGQSAAARAALEDAVGVFRDCGYIVGEVEAVLSLARVHAPVDRNQTHLYLTRAKELLEPTDLPTRPPRSTARQMPGARAAFYSREAEFELARGNFIAAKKSYEKDLKLTMEFAGAKGEGAPRALGYVYRHLGRVCLALGSPVESVSHLQNSVGCFRRVEDSINAFFSQTLLCEVHFAMQNHSAAEQLIVELEKAVEKMPDRAKEGVIVQVLRAQWIWLAHLDEERALGMLRDAKNTLRSFGRDYHYVRLLLVESEVLLGCRDESTARWRLREARSCALSLEMEELRRRAEEMLRSMGAPLTEHATPEGRLELSIFFADIRGFTDACRKVATPTMAEFITEFAETISRFTSLSEGRPVRFLGDCVMVIFGLTETAYQKELLAIEAAAATHERFCLLRERWGRRNPELGRVGLGFGISSGEVIAGRFGSEELSEYSVIGEAVNLASRLQGEAKDGEIMICPQVAARVAKAIPDLPLPTKRVILKGIGEVDAPVLRARDVHGLLRRAPNQGAR